MISVARRADEVGAVGHLRVARPCTDLTRGLYEPVAVETDRIFEDESQVDRQWLTAGTSSCLESRDDIVRKVTDQYLRHGLHLLPANAPVRR